MKKSSAMLVVVLVNSVLFTACGSMKSLGDFDSPNAAASSADTVNSFGQYGDHHAVQATIETVKVQGEQAKLSSRAIRLPERTLGEIAVYGFQFPPACGAHQFRVVEAEGTQILEYRFATQGGETEIIRDYIMGPSPFTGPGLWTAYDHTANSISTMTSDVEARGDRMLKGTYSRGLVTSLPVIEQRALGNAYQQAVRDVHACREAQTLAKSTNK